jgi:hypothetical protein
MRVRRGTGGVLGRACARADGAGGIPTACRLCVYLKKMKARLGFFLGVNSRRLGVRHHTTWVRGRRNGVTWLCDAWKDRCDWCQL